MSEDKKPSWEQFYSRFDPYGQEKWLSDKKRRASTIELLFKRGLHLERCLELGCGEGRITRELSRICDQIVAVEMSSNAIKTAKKVNESNLDKIQFIEDNMYQVSFADNEFDLINGIEALDYTDNRKSEICKWIRWLKPGGFIIFSGPNLRGYFSYEELTRLFSFPELEIVERRIVTTKTPIQYLMNRNLLPQTDLLWDVNILLAGALPRFLSKHIAILAKKREG